MLQKISTDMRELANVLAFVDEHNVEGQIEKQWETSKRKPNPVRHFIETASVTIKRWMSEASALLRNKIIHTLEKITENNVTWDRDELVPVRP